jgi:serine/threonine-protein kinase
MSQTRRIGQFEITDQLGEGGIGRVYIANDTILDRQVAIKSLRPELVNDSSFVDRFRMEAKSLARLNHPNITTLYTLHEEAGHFYMIMELVRGRTLEAILQDRATPFTTEEALAIVAQVADGLAYAHEMGIVHRDIKPANLILTGGGLLKIMDFGIARLQGSQRMTRDGSVVGTLAYMSPEQCRGQEADGRSDLYSLAIVLYEMLTKDVPFSASSDYDMMQAHINNAPVLPSRRAPGIAPHVESALMKALAKRREDRFATIAEFKQALGAPASRTEAVNIVHGVTRLIGSSMTAHSQPLISAASRVSQSVRKSDIPFSLSGVAVGVAAALLFAAAIIFWPSARDSGTKTADLGVTKAVAVVSPQVARQSQNPYFLPATESKPASAPSSGGAIKLGSGGSRPPFEVAAEPNGGGAAQAAAEVKRPADNAGAAAAAQVTIAPPVKVEPPSTTVPKERKYTSKEVVAAYEIKDFASARERAETCAKDGDADCQFYLGRMFESGFGGAQNAGAAAEWYRKAAEAGQARACYNLGVLYLKGDGVPRDPRTAAEWLSKAAYQNIALAQFNLALLYEKGEGVPKDTNLARRWYGEAAKSSDAQLAANAQEALDNLNGKRRR